MSYRCITKNIINKMNFKNFYRKHVDKIVIILIILLFLKGCGKKSAERRMDFASTKYEMAIDSLNNIIDNKVSLIDSLYNVNTFPATSAQPSPVRRRIPMALTVIPVEIAAITWDIVCSSK